MVRRLVSYAAREVGDVAKGTTATHTHLRERLLAALAGTVVLDVIGSSLVLWLERNEPQTGIHTLGDAVFWTTSQLLTVSSSLPNPLSTGGRILDIVLEFYAITVVAWVAGSFGAFFHRRGIERHPLNSGEALPGPHGEGGSPPSAA